MSVVVTYHPLLNSLRKVLSKNLDIIDMGGKLKKCFVRDPWIYFKVLGKLVVTC